MPQGRSTRRLKCYRRGLRLLATLSLAYATGCDGGRFASYPLTTDTSDQVGGEVWKLLELIFVLRIGTLAGNAASELDFVKLDRGKQIAPLLDSNLES